MARIDELGQRRAPLERWIDRLAGRFVAVVLLASVVTFAAWAPTSIAAAFEHAMALLVVTCPCALALAAPLALAVTLGRGARQGILIKGLYALEVLARPGTIVVDKTGTLTEGRLELASVDGDRTALRLAAAVERHSAHPIARALLAGVETAPLATAVREELGHGVEGTVEGRAVAVGAVPWLRLGGVHVPPHLEAALADIAGRAESPIAIAVDGEVVTVLGLADPIRVGAAADLRALAAAGWAIELLSGDDARVAQRVGAQLGLPAARCHGGVTPEGKLARVRELRAGGGTVVMVGDGVNDAAAMAAASCGIAVSGAAEVALDAADVLLRQPGIGGVLAVIDAGRATLAALRRSLWISLGYNAVSASLAAAGIIHPLLAAILMPISSASVLAMALRSRAFVAAPPPPQPAPRFTTPIEVHP